MGNENNQVLKALSDQLCKTSISSPRIKEGKVGLGHAWNLEWEVAALAKFLDGEEHVLESLCAEMTRAAQLTNAEPDMPQQSSESCSIQLPWRAG